MYSSLYSLLSSTAWIFGLSRHPLGSTVRLRLRKSISGFYFQTIRKLFNNDFQYHSKGIYSEEWYILIKKGFFSSYKEFYIDLLSHRLAGRPFRSSPQGLTWRGNTGESSREGGLGPPPATHIKKPAKKAQFYWRGQTDTQDASAKSMPSVA